ncbi:MAG: hypothetical protein CMK09_03385 [Ponticaulis sp.]|nr:hypothetical protein [Ponticaulis sp.]
MKYTLIFGITLAVTAHSTALAEEKSIIDYALEKGSIVTVMGTPYVAMWNEDGTYTADGLSTIYTGTWRRDGDAFCIHPTNEVETCSDYPAGQKPGDDFNTLSDV